MSHYHKIQDWQCLFEQPLLWEPARAEPAGLSRHKLCPRTEVALTACQDNCQAFPAAPLPWRSAAPARWSCPGTAAPPASRSPTAPRRRTCGEITRQGSQPSSQGCISDKMLSAGCPWVFCFTKVFQLLKNHVVIVTTPPSRDRRVPTPLLQWEKGSGEKNSVIHVTMFLKQCFQLLPGNHKGQQKWKKAVCLIIGIDYWQRKISIVM